MAGTWYPTKNFKFYLPKGQLRLTGTQLKVVLLTKTAGADPGLIPLTSWQNYGNYQTGDGYQGPLVIDQFELSATGYIPASNPACPSVNPFTIIQSSVGVTPIVTLDLSDVVWSALDTTGTNGIYGFSIVDFGDGDIANVPFPTGGLVIGTYLYDTVIAPFTTSNFKIVWGDTGVIQI